MENQIDPLKLNLFTYEVVGNVIGRSTRMIFNYANSFKIRPGRLIPKDKTKYFTIEQVYKFAKQVAELDGFEYKPSDVEQKINEIKELKKDFQSDFKRPEEEKKRSKNEEVEDVYFEHDYQKNDNIRKDLSAMNSRELLDKIIQDNMQIGASTEKIKYQEEKIQNVQNSLKKSRIMLVVLCVIISGTSYFWFQMVQKKIDVIVLEKNRNAEMSYKLKELTKEIDLYNQKLSFLQENQKENAYKIEQYKEIIKEKNAIVAGMSEMKDQVKNASNEEDETINAR